MRRAKKKRLFNIIMVAIIAAIVFSGVMAVGSIRGWFSDEETISVSKVLGNATIERNGIAYSLTEGTALQVGDSIGTLDGSTASLGIASLGSLTLGENTQVTIHSAEGSEISIEAEGGEVFGNGRRTGTNGVDTECRRPYHRDRNGCIFTLAHRPVRRVYMCIAAALILKPKTLRAKRPRRPDRRRHCLRTIPAERSVC